MTAVFVAVLIAAIVIFDIFIIMKKGKYHSISAFIIRASHKYPSVPFLLGFVCGHLFWSMDTSDWSVLK
jgi:hypothetical protein